ncbi:uncharacterized protein LOC113228609 [Hyposmocoma kahamanoa]|uniref:uncharacterized protein LOC113228609 n=1 Tax=Hyposmocoma kahamanoa TaxID=1477025 RepID=UPI000E6D839B|nr:uncharacterized protein LOC113228609 [Hyposmocoma kahamanoa]
MAKIFLHYTCCLIVLTICVDQGDGMRKKRAEETANRYRGEEFMRKKERIDDIVREIDLLKDIAEMVDHHIDDFYEEYPKATKREHSPKTRHYSHKSFHDWLTTERRPEATEQWNKSTKRRSKSTKKALRERFRFNFNDTIYDKQKNRSGEQPDSNNDFNLQKNTKIRKATTELLNKYHVKIQNRGKQYLHTSSDSEYDLENSKYSKTTEMKTTTESAYNYHATNKKYVDDDLNLHKNVRTKSAAELPNKYYPHKDKYEGDFFGYHKNSKTTEKPTPEFPNKYYANSKIIVGDDFNFNKNIKTTDNTVYELQSKYRANSRTIEDDDYDFYKYSNTTGKTK